MGLIYKITNDINDKIYIGQTTRDIMIRWQAHINRANNQDENMHICNAIKKYGAEHFRIEKIEECDNSLLDEREVYWINYYDSYNNGYNSSLGGNGWHKVNHEEAITLWKNGYSLEEISIKIGCCIDSVRHHIYSIDGVREQLNKDRYERLGVPISQYTLMGDYVATYSSIQEASRAIGCGKSTLSSSLSSGMQSCQGYQWRYGTSKDNIGIVQNSTRKAIVQSDKDGNYIATYPSLSEASRATGISTSNLSRACKKGYKYGGFIWEYYQHWEVKLIEESIENN